jgi:hypothetical protein
MMQHRSSNRPADVPHHTTPPFPNGESVFSHRTFQEWVGGIGQTSQGPHDCGIAGRRNESPLPKAANADVATIPGAHTKRRHQASLGIVAQQASNDREGSAELRQVGQVDSASRAVAGLAVGHRPWSKPPCGTQRVLRRVKAMSHETPEALKPGHGHTGVYTPSHNRNLNHCRTDLPVVTSKSHSFTATPQQTSTPPEGC